MCKSDKDCKSGRKCVTPIRSGSSKKQCIQAPFECKKDKDCERGRVCKEDREFKEVKKVCKNSGLGTKCKKDRDCPRDRNCKHGMCKGKKLKVRDRLWMAWKYCRVCVYSFTVVFVAVRYVSHRKTARSRRYACTVRRACSGYAKPRSVRRARIARRTRLAWTRGGAARDAWTSRTSVPRTRTATSARSAWPAPPQTTPSVSGWVVAGRHFLEKIYFAFYFSTKTGFKCKRAKDCKQKSHVCIRSKADNFKEKRCLSVPFNCHKDSDCEEGKFCVKNGLFQKYHTCEVRPKRCSDHKECADFEECIETLVEGFSGAEWSFRCLTVPYKRCTKVRSKKLQAAAFFFSSNKIYILHW